MTTTDQQKEKHMHMLQTSERPPNRLPIAIASTIAGLVSVCMCCIGVILGAIAIVFATQADTKYRLEDYTGAESSARVAFILSIVSLSISALSILIILFFVAIKGISGIGDIASNIDSSILDHLY